MSRTQTRRRAAPMNTAARTRRSGRRRSAGGGEHSFHDRASSVSHRSAAVWISDSNAGVSTLYSVPGANSTPVSINGLVVSIPTPGDPLGTTGAHRDRVQPRRRPDGRVHGERRGQERKPDHRLGGLPVRHRGRYDRRLAPRRQPQGL